MKKLKLFSLSLLASSAVGQTILSVLSIQTDLSMLNSFIDSSPTISRLLSTANNFTFLAPSNTAINAWLAAPGTTSLQTDQIEALISYHLLHGTFPVASFSQIPQFPNSNLNNLTFENITGDQAVELLQSPSGPQILSGNTTVSTISRAVSLVLGLGLYEPGRKLKAYRILLAPEASFKSLTPYSPSHQASYLLQHHNRIYNSSINS
jgi:hypothetical protein